MIMNERRHRLNAIEINPVKEAIEKRLLSLISGRSDLLTAQILFRAWYRIHAHVKNKPSYPPHESFTEMSNYLEYGSETEEED